MEKTIQSRQYQCVFNSCNIIAPQFISSHSGHRPRSGTYNVPGLLGRARSKQLSQIQCPHSHWITWSVLCVFSPRQQWQVGPRFAVNGALWG
jgi:hypothetical protein